MEIKNVVFANAESKETDMRKFAMGTVAINAVQHDVTESLQVTTVLKVKKGTGKMFGVEADVMVTQDLEFDAEKDAMDELLEAGFENIKTELKKHYMAAEVDAAYNELLEGEVPWD